LISVKQLLKTLEGKTASADRASLLKKKDYISTCEFESRLFRHSMWEKYIEKGLTPVKTEAKPRKRLFSRGELPIDTDIL